MLHAHVFKRADRHAQTAPPHSARAIDLARWDGSDWLAEEWRALEAHARWPTQSHAFAAALTPLIEGQRRKLLGLRAGRTISALLPLCRDAGAIGRWRIAGSRELFEPGDLLAARPDDAAPIADALARLRQPLSFDRISADSPLLPALRRAMHGRGLLSVRPAMPCPLIVLDESWRDPESHFNSGRRSDFRRAARRAEALGPVTFETLAPGLQDFDALFDEAIGVEAKSWKLEAGSAIAVDRRRETFFRRFFREAAAEGRFRLSFMRIGGEAVAMQLAQVSDDRYWLFKIGHDDRFGKCSPGTLLMLHTLRWAAGEGLRSYELLGEAEGWITRFWTQEQRACVRVRTYPAGASGALALAADGAHWVWQRLVRRGA